MIHSGQYGDSGAGAPFTAAGFKRSRSHQRTPSASTVTSLGPISPLVQSNNAHSYPYIANAEQSPSSSTFWANQDHSFTKHFPQFAQFSTDGNFSTNGHVPSLAVHMPDAHLAMKGFAIDHHSAEDYNNEVAPSRQSMSSHGGNDSPATPQSGAGETDPRQYSLPQNGGFGMITDLWRTWSLLDDTDYSRSANPHVQLCRTESQAYQDELYNPNVVYASAPAKPQAKNNYLSPRRNMLTERLQTADMARSMSPNSAASRAKSPFRGDSEFATNNKLVTAAGMRQQQKEEAAQAEYEQHRIPLHREPTKTISPQDAVLDYPDQDQPSLFQDTIPTGYEKHIGGTEHWPSNDYLGHPGATFGALAGNDGSQQIMGFRSADAGFPGAVNTTFDFSNGMPASTDQGQNNPFGMNYQSAVGKMPNHFHESTPDFPAQLPSMETSHSDAGTGAPTSSQESNVNNGVTSMPQRPADTRANTGTYTCTYHGCTQRFDSHANLQKHKREYHRSQNSARDTASSMSGAGSASPGSDPGSPDDSGSGMTSAQLLARNTQAGPHKCTRINPATGKPCNTIFSRPYDLTRHEDTIHNNRKQKVRCPMCREEKTFSRNDALTRHMRVVHPEVDTSGKRSRRGD